MRICQTTRMQGIRCRYASREPIHGGRQKARKKCIHGADRSGACVRVGTTRVMGTGIQELAWGATGRGGGVAKGDKCVGVREARFRTHFGQDGKWPPPLALESLIRADCVCSDA